MSYMSIRSGLFREVKTYVKMLVRPKCPPDRRFVIFGPGRCGSSLLVSLLNSHPSVHCDGELLHDPILAKILYIDCRALIAPGEIYGFKLLTYQLRSVQRIRDPGGFLRRLFDRGYGFLYLSRRDTLRHALSNLYARRRGVFHHHVEDGVVNAQKVYIDPEELTTWMRWREKTSQFELRLLDDIPHLSLVYEADLLESESHQHTVDRISQYLGIPSADVQATYAKVTPSNLIDFVDNYDEIVRSVEKTEFKRFLHP
jgi:LPS sulfotransferase NodH